MKGIKDLQDEVHMNAVLHGFWDEGLNIPEKLALIHSEVSEGLEEYRKHGADRKMFLYTDPETGKPEGLASELADTVIRCLDLAGGLGMDLEEAIGVKMEYNKTRERKHGKVC